MRLLIWVVLVFWFVVVILAGAAGSFSRPPGTPPLPLLIGAAAPLIVFFAAYWGWPGFKRYVLSIDLPLAAAIQGWRFAGLGFIALYVYGVLPGSFAGPAGLGDIAIGVTAPWVARALIRRPGFVTSRVFALWNWLGILDLVDAVTIGALSSMFASGAAGEVTAAPMARLPLVLIPAYLVPLFVMLHAAALFQAHRQAGSTRV